MILVLQKGRPGRPQSDRGWRVQIRRALGFAQKLMPGGIHRGEKQPWRADLCIAPSQQILVRVVAKAYRVVKYLDQNPGLITRRPRAAQGRAAAAREAQRARDAASWQTVPLVGRGAAAGVRVWGHDENCRLRLALPCHWQLRGYWASLHCARDSQKQLRRIGHAGGRLVRRLAGDS